MVISYQLPRKFVFIRGVKYEVKKEPWIKGYRPPVTYKERCT